MPKIDCEKTLNFITVLDRMCESNPDCVDCPLYTNITNHSCMAGIRNHPEKTLKAVQKWSDEHPIETYMEDFLKLFPNASLTRMNTGDLCPVSCRAHIYGEDTETISLCEKHNNNCYSCWNEIKKEENI